MGFVLLSIEGTLPIQSCMAMLVLFGYCCRYYNIFINRLSFNESTALYFAHPLYYTLQELRNTGPNKQN